MVVVGQTQGGLGCPRKKLSLDCFVTTCVGLPTSMQMCACVPIYVSPVSVGPQRSGCVCSFSTMKSFLKPANNVKGKRGEVEPPSWVPVTPLRLGLQPLAWPSVPSAPIIREVPSWGLGEQKQLGARGPPSQQQPVGLFIFLSHCLPPWDCHLDREELIVSKPTLSQTLGCAEAVFSGHHL